MREIKFRGKRVDGKGWVQGSLIANNGTPYIVSNVIESNNEFITLEDWRQVIPETVGQLTGYISFDKKESIYEGDIAQYDGDLYTVTFNYGDCYLKCPYSDDDLKMSDTLYLKGNIHDNPELLKN